jgi:hypothetical protein
MCCGRAKRFQTEVWWSAHADSSEWASSSTFGVRKDFQTISPVAAAQNPNTVNSNLFIFVSFTLLDAMSCTLGCRLRRS